MRGHKIIAKSQRPSCYMFPITQRYRAQFPSRRLFAALIAISGLSIFARVDANANEPAQASTEVHWPPGYSPKTADIYAYNEIVIHASPSTVWRWLIAAEQWPNWYSNAQNVRIITSEKVLVRIQNLGG